MSDSTALRLEYVAPRNRRVILVHGAGVFFGDSSLFRLDYQLMSQGVSVVKFRYGFTFTLSVFFANGRASKSLAKIMRPYDLIIGHSNGCLVADKAIRLEEKFDGAGICLLCFSPALNKDHEFSGRWKQIDVVSNPGDYTSISEWIPFHPWGSMMRDGIINRALRHNESVTSIQKVTGMNRSFGHGSYFHDLDSIKEISNWIMKTEFGQ